MIAPPKGHAGRGAVGEQAARIDAVDEVYRDPELAVGLAAAVNADDVPMPKGRSEVGLAVEPRPVVRVGRPVQRQQLQKQSQEPLASERCSVGQRPAEKMPIPIGGDQHRHAAIDPKDEFVAEVSEAIDRVLSALDEPKLGLIRPT